MKSTFITLCAVCLLSLFSCKDDEGKSCLTCENELTQPFELCRESNGNASVNGDDTGVSYDVYLSGLDDLGTSCN